MAIASAFGFSGWDPIGSTGEAWLNSAFTTHLAKKSNSWSVANMRKQADLQYQYARQYALNSPSWTVEGLRNAGLNPILATGNSSPTLPNVSPIQTPIPFHPSDSAGGFDNTAFQLQKLATKQARANVALTTSQAEATRQNAVTNQWQMFDAKSIGAAGFNVQFVGSAGARGDYKVIHTLRINKVTGEAYDALTGQRVRVIDEIPVNSGKTSPADNSPATYNQYNFNYTGYRDFYKPQR